MTPAGLPGALRRASLRRQIALMEHVRDTMAGEKGDDFARWTKALMPLTDALLHELAKAEQGPAYVPYPHPMACQWWDAIDLAGVTTEATPLEGVAVCARCGHVLTDHDGDVGGSWCRTPGCACSERRATPNKPDTTPECPPPASPEDVRAIRNAPDGTA